MHFRDLKEMIPQQQTVENKSIIAQQTHCSMTQQHHTVSDIKMH